jgi:hypothetical protein
MFIYFSLYVYNNNEHWSLNAEGWFIQYVFFTACQFQYQDPTVDSFVWL